MHIKTIIVDDEDKNRDVIKLKLIKNCPDIAIVDLASSAKEAFEKILIHKPDVVFLDISMPSESGLDMLSRFDTIDFEIIFVTGYNEYALEALKVSAVDYLLKPVLDEDLKKAVEKAKVRILKKDRAHRYDVLQHNLKNVGDQETQLAIPGTNAYDFIKIKDIIRCEGWQKYTRIYFTNGKHILSSYNLGVYKDLLEKYQFYVSHKSHLINILHIKRYLKEGIVIMSDGAEVPVSRRKKDEFASTVLNEIKVKWQN